MSDRRLSPEDLSALGRRGLLSEAEEHELDRALRDDAVLRAAHLVGQDLDRSTAVRAGDEALVLRVADRALSQVAKSGLAPARREPVSSFGPMRERKRRRTLTVLLAAALLLVTGAATAVWSGLPARLFTRGVEMTHPMPPANAPAPRAAAKLVVTEESTALVGPGAPAEVTEAIAEPLALEPSSSGVTAAPRIAAHSSAETSAAALFSGANAARRDGDFARARRGYTELIARYPSSDEARLARVSLGKLLLAKGNPSEAEREFDQYLKAGHGQLTEEALVSRAQSLQKLGKKDAERRTWRALLGEYPNSVYAAEAKRRLEALRPAAASPAP